MVAEEACPLRFMRYEIMFIHCAVISCKPILTCHNSFALRTNICQMKENFSTFAGNKVYTNVSDLVAFPEKDRAFGFLRKNRYIVRIPFSDKILARWSYG